MTRALLLWLVLSGSAFAFTVPPASSPVVDEARLLDADTRAFLDQKLRDLRQRGGSQIGVLTVPSLQGLSIEQASIRVADAWKLGSSAKDDGVIVLIARDEREARIEVGQGLEGVLTDLHANRILDRIMIPEFKNGDYGRGVLFGVNAILAYTDPEAAGSFLDGSGSQASVRRPTGDSGVAAGGWLRNVLIILFLIVVFAGRGFGGRRRYRRGGIWIGGGWGGGSGWSGGGGGFSGGGASGKW